jgi:hypothetical protein
LTTSNKIQGSRARPTLDTPFHIDYDWWQRDGRDLRTYLISHLLPEQRKQFENGQNDGAVDYIDPETAEVRRVDALQQALMKAAADPQYISDHTTLVDAVFRAFLANGNKALTSNELSRVINRPAQTILRTLAGSTGQIYKGIRPVIE